MIRFENVTKVYDQKARPALDSINLEIDRGEFAFLVGASGSGKSTFLRLVLKEDRASSGAVYVAGQNVANISSWRVPRLRRGIGVVFQDFRLLPQKTVFANVAFAMQVIGKSRSVIRETVPEVLKTVGLEGKENRLPHELSGGEQQRVAIARAVVNRPGILLADEPTGNLDPTTSMGIMGVLDKINQNGTTVVMATHDDDIVNEMRKRVVELAQRRHHPRRGQGPLHLDDSGGGPVPPAAGCQRPGPADSAAARGEAQRRRGGPAVRLAFILGRDRQRPAPQPVHGGLRHPGDLRVPDLRRRRRHAAAADQPDEGLLVRQSPGGRLPLQRRFDGGRLRHRPGHRRNSRTTCASCWSPRPWPSTSTTSSSNPRTTPTSTSRNSSPTPRSSTR